MQVQRRSFKAGIISVTLDKSTGMLEISFLRVHQNQSMYRTRDGYVAQPHLEIFVVPAAKGPDLAEGPGPCWTSRGSISLDKDTSLDLVCRPEELKSFAHHGLGLNQGTFDRQSPIERWCRTL
jgi:hypothetical protein